MSKKRKAPLRVGFGAGKIGVGLTEGSLVFTRGKARPIGSVNKRAGKPFMLWNFKEPGSVLVLIYWLSRVGLSLMRPKEEKP